MDQPLRRANLDDLDTVMTLENAGFPPGVVEDRQVFARRIAGFPEGFLLAGEPAWGYFCAEVWAEYDPSDAHRFDLGHDIGAYLDRAGSVLYLASMTVAPGHRGGGRGRLLFRAGMVKLVCDFPNLTRAVLIVNEHWAGARVIYQGEGFRETGRLAGFFRPTTGPVGDALVMERDLVRQPS